MQSYDDRPFLCPSDYHVCDSSCFNKDGTKICDDRKNFTSMAALRERTPMSTEVVTISCLNLMGAVQYENKSLIAHRESLADNIKYAEKHRGLMLEYERAAQGEIELIREVTKKLEDYKAQLIKELAPASQEATPIVEELGRSV